MYSSQSGVVKLKAPTDPQSSVITEEDVSIASLRTLIASLEPQIAQLGGQIAELDKKARDAVATEQLATAKAALRSKKLVDTKLQQRSATLAQLEEVYAKIEQAADQVEIVRVMQASSQTLKALNKQTGGVEKVQDVVDGLREEMMNADEIGQAINDVTAGEIEEGEVDDELAALEETEKEKVAAAERERLALQEAIEAEETRKKLAELDRVVQAGTPVKEKGETQANYARSDLAAEAPLSGT